MWLLKNRNHRLFYPDIVIHDLMWHHHSRAKHLLAVHVQIWACPSVGLRINILNVMSSYDILFVLWLHIDFLMILACDGTRQSGRSEYTCSIVWNVCCPVPKYARKINMSNSKSEWLIRQCARIMIAELYTAHILIPYHFRDPGFYPLAQCFAVTFSKPCIFHSSWKENLKGGCLRVWRYKVSIRGKVMEWKGFGQMH